MTLLQTIRVLRSLALVSATALLAACQTMPGDSATQPGIKTPKTSSDSESQPSADYWQLITLPLHGQQIANGDSFSVIVPRTDIDLESEMGPIPISAGIASHLYFFRCTCGKMKTLGDITARDDESDNVIDALRSGQFSIVSISPLLNGTRPRLVSIRFQAEGDADDLVKTLASALKQTGPADHAHPTPAAP